MVEENTLEDCILKSIAGFKQSQICCGNAESYLKAKERWSAREYFLYHCFFVPHRHYESLDPKLVEAINKFGGPEEFYRRLLGDVFSRPDYQRLMELESELNMAKEKNKTVCLKVPLWSSWDGFGGGIRHQTVYFPLQIMDAYFKETGLHIVPEGNYCYRTDHGYPNDEDTKQMYAEARRRNPFLEEPSPISRCCKQDKSCKNDSISISGSDCGHNCQNEIVIENPQHKMIEISFP
jgi:hypothetical protein